MNYKTILQFWFNDTDPKLWWLKDAVFDQLIRDRFFKIHNQAVQGELFTWRKTAEGRLAEIIVLDQFSRNIFRNSAFAFANDSMALALSQEAIARGADKDLNSTQRSFLYLPFMHSESLAIHKVALELYSKIGLPSNLEFEKKHKQIIERFGRYPHRNSVYGRTNTPEEEAFLQTPGSSF